MIPFLRLDVCVGSENNFLAILGRPATTLFLLMQANGANRKHNRGND